MADDQNSASTPQNPAPTPPVPPIDYAATQNVGYQGPPPDQNAKTMGMLCHLLGIFTGFLGPLIVWLLKKQEHPFIDYCGKEALNFHITIAIGLVIGMATFCIFIGIAITPIVAIYGLVMTIIATMKTSNGEAYRYPFALRLIK